MDVDTVHTWLERAARRRPHLPPPQVLVESPRVTLRSGDLDRPFHTASVGKLFTTALTGQLVGGGRFALDTPLGRLLPATDLAGLPAADGVDVATTVTVRHLLTHTSGLPDYFDPPRGHDTRCSRTRFADDPDHRWTPAELLDEVRGLPPVAAPGRRFAYSDTGFVLLGRIIEETTGLAYPQALRERVLAPLGMDRTGMPHHELTAAELATLDVAPLVIGDHEVSRRVCTSVDWAGGGVVTTVDDLVRFQRALHAGDLVPTALLDAFVRPAHRFRWGIEYGAGVMTLRLDRYAPLARRMPRPVGHLGVSATHLFHHPEQDGHVVLNFHSTAEMVRSVQCHVVLGRLLSTAG